MRRYTDDPLVWMLVGGLGFGLFIGILRASGPVELLLWVLGGVFVSLIAFTIYLDPQPHTAIIFTLARPPAVRSHVRDRFGRAPWVPGVDTPGELLFWRRLQPNLFVAVVLALFGVVPAVIYVVLAMRSTQTILVVTEAERDRTAVNVTIRPRSHDGRRITNKLVNSLIRLGERVDLD